MNTLLHKERLPCIHVIRFFAFFCKILASSLQEKLLCKKNRYLIDVKKVTLQKTNFTLNDLFVNFRSLHPEHRLLFAAFMTLKLRWTEISREELLFLIHGNPHHHETISLESFGTPLAHPDWIPKDRFHDVMALSLLPTAPLSGLCRDMVENEIEWKSWLNEENCEMVSLPRDEDYAWKDIHKLIVIRILRPDRFAPALKRFVEVSFSLSSI